MNAIGISVKNKYYQKGVNYMKKFTKTFAFFSLFLIVGNSIGEFVGVVILKEQPNLVESLKFILAELTIVVFITLAYNAFVKRQEKKFVQ